MSSSDPASLVRAVTPSDTVEFSLCRALYVGVGGNVCDFLLRITHNRRLVLAWWVGVIHGRWST
jgi:hypothetical protein